MQELTKEQKRELMREFMASASTAHYSEYDIRQRIFFTMALYKEDNLAQLISGMPEFRNAKFNNLPYKTIGKIGLDALTEVMPIDLLMEYKEVLENKCVQEVMDLFPKWLKLFQQRFEREAFIRSSKREGLKSVIN